MRRPNEIDEDGHCLMGVFYHLSTTKYYFIDYYYHYKILLIDCLSFNISGCVDVDITSRLYSDLCEAQLALSVQNYLHLIYLITPYDLVAHITPDWSVMFNLVSVTYSCPGTQSTKYCKISNNQFFLS